MSKNRHLRASSSRNIIIEFPKILKNDLDKLNAPEIETENIKQQKCELMPKFFIKKSFYPNRLNVNFIGEFSNKISANTPSSKLNINESLRLNHLDKNGSNQFVEIKPKIFPMFSILKHQSSPRLNSKKCVNNETITQILKKQKMLSRKRETDSTIIPEKENSDFYPTEELMINEELLFNFVEAVNNEEDLYKSFKDYWNQTASFDFEILLVSS